MNQEQTKLPTSCKKVDFEKSLVTKLGDIITIVSILKAIESLKFLLRSIYILLKTVKIVIIGKNRIFSVRAYDQQTFTILHVLNAVISLI